jgi:UPF0716 family protein affecting phage T7 exclusion
MQLEEFAPEELEMQRGELLPSREAMALLNVANVTGTNVALALNTASFSSGAWAQAEQGIEVFQF